MIQYCIPLERIVESTEYAPQPLPATGLTVYGISHTPKVISSCSEGSQSGSCLYHCLCYSVALPPLALSTQDKHMLCLVCPWLEAHLRLASARLLLGLMLNKDYSCINLMLQLIQWSCQLRG